jgi:hypothetical protein
MLYSEIIAVCSQIHTLLTRQNTTIQYSVAHKLPHAMSQFQRTNTVQLFPNCSPVGRKPNISVRRPGISGVAHSIPPTALSVLLNAHLITQSLALPNQSPIGWPTAQLQPTRLPAQFPSFIHTLTAVSLHSQTASSLTLWFQVTRNTWSRSWTRFSSVSLRLRTGQWIIWPAICLWEV